MSLSEKLIFWVKYNDFKRNIAVLSEKSSDLSENTWFSKQKPGAWCNKRRKNDILLKSYLRMRGDAIRGAKYFLK